MSDKKQNKEYSAGNGKKWLVGLAVLVLLAIIVVVIVIAIPPSTNSARELVSKATKTSFMVNENEKKSFGDFESKVKNNENTNGYMATLQAEMSDVQNLSTTVSKVLEYYNGYMLFIEGNNAFSQQFKDIKNGLNGAQEDQKQLNSIMEEVNKLSGHSATYIQNAWVDFRVEYTNWLGNMNEAIRALAISYEECMGNTTTNNPASTLVLNTASDYIQSIYNGFSKIVVEENENPNRTSYTYNLQGQIDEFDNFVSNLINDDTFIRNYYFTGEYQTLCNQLNSFFILYNEADLVNVISSMNNEGEVTKTYEIEDTAGVYNKVKNFLTGGV